MLCVTGCDNGQNEADKQTRADLTEAQQKTSEGDTVTANAKLTSAAGNAAASAGLRASAKASLAQAEFEAGQNIVAKIDMMERDLSRVAFEIGQLANQIRISSAEVTSSREYDPKPAKDAINSAIADAQGGPDKPAWFTQGNAVLPTLTAANDQVVKLQADLSQKQDQVKNLTQQRGVLLDQAEQATAQVDQLKGNQALDVFKRASDLRRQAGEISVQIDTLQNDIATVQDNLSVAQAQQAAASDAVTQLKDQIATLDKTWAEVDAKAADHQKLAADILGGASASAAAGSSAGGSITQKAAEWSRLTKEIRDMRNDAEAKLGDAARSFDDARKAADELRKDLSDQITDPKNTGRPEIAAWENARLAMDPAQFRLQFATAQRALGELHLSEATSAGIRASVVASLQSALEGTSLRVPPELLAGDLSTERSNALKSADAALHESDDSLENIINGRSDIKNIATTAKIARALTLYDWSQVSRQMGNPADAKAHLTAATEARNSAAEDNAIIPAMPAELGPIPTKPSADSAQADATTQPATAPAVQ
jgi:hypothetical protein